MKGTDKKACELKKRKLGGFGVYYRKIRNSDYVRFVYSVDDNWYIICEPHIDELTEEYYAHKENSE